MKVILLQNIYKTGVAGEVVDVADGFARNYLIPRKMAVKATKSALKNHRQLAEKVEARRAAYENIVNEVAEQINGVELFFERRAAATGKLFGSVTTQEIAEELERQTTIDINRRRISQQPLRELGSHRVPVRMGTDQSPELTITIVREGELEEFLAERERQANAPDEAEAAEQGDDGQMPRPARIYEQVAPPTEPQAMTEDEDVPPASDEDVAEAADEALAE